MSKQVSAVSKQSSVNSTASGVASLNTTEIKAGQLAVFNEIGEGRFKTVSSGRHSRHGLCAILRYKAESNRNEARILGLLSHGGNKHIPEVYGAQIDRSGLTLAQEFATFGSVRSLLQDPEMESSITLRHKLHISCQMTEAASFLESMRVVHTDLACRNFLVFKLEEDPQKTKIKVTDFMNALCLPGNTNHLVKKMPQATRWCAPETAASNKWSHKTDIWSLGATLWELFADGVAPWPSYCKRGDVANRLREIAFKTDASIADLSDDFEAAEACKCPPAAHAALLSCLHPRAKERPSAEQLTAAFGQILSSLQTPVEIGEQRVLHSAVSSPPAQRSQPAPLAACVISPPQSCEQSTATKSTHHCQRNEQARPSQTLPSTPEKDISPAGFAMTPPTRCPSTPEAVQLPGTDSQRVSVDSTPQVTPHSIDRVFDSSKVPSMLEVSRKIANLASLKACLASPDTQPADLSDLKDFLSSPEAVCGLDVESLISLRRRAAAAQDLKRYPAESHGPIYLYDTIVPLATVNNSWCISRGMAQF